MELSGIDIFDNNQMAPVPNDNANPFDSDTDEILINMDESLMQDSDDVSQHQISDQPEEEPAPKVSKPDKSHLLKFIDQGYNKNTKVKTERDVSKFIKYMRSQGEEREMTDLSNPELNILVGAYFMQLKKANGEPYEPSTITGIHR